MPEAVKEKVVSAPPPTVAAPNAQPVVLNAVPLAALTVEAKNTSDQTVPGNVLVVDGRVVNAHGEPIPGKAVDETGKIVDAPAAKDAPL